MCCRDYRKYITATPAPHDLREVELELQEVMELQRRKMREDQARHDQEYRRGSTGSGGGGGGMWGFAQEQEDAKEEFFRRFAGGQGRGGGRGQRRVVESDSEQEEEEDEEVGEDHYSQLGVPAGASERDIKSAYRKLALK